MSTPCPESAAEEWRPVVGYEGIYEVSSLGGMRRLARTITENRAGSAVQRHLPAKLLSRRVGAVGYPVTDLTLDGVRRTLYVHRLVAEAFLRRADPAMHVNHIDSCRTNNRVENLEWVTQAQNNRHAAEVAVMQGTPRVNRARKLTLKCAREIRRLRAEEGMTYAAIAARFRVNIQTARRIATGEYWRETPRRAPRSATATGAPS